jgi:hypothetical protein
MTEKQLRAWLIDQAQRHIAKKVPLTIYFGGLHGAEFAKQFLSTRYGTDLSATDYGPFGKLEGTVWNRCPFGG